MIYNIHIVYLDISDCKPAGILATFLPKSAPHGVQRHLPCPEALNQLGVEKWAAMGTQFCLHTILLN